MSYLTLRRSQLLAITGVLTFAIFASISVAICQDNVTPADEKTPEVNAEQATTQQTASPDASQPVDFVKQIEPIFTSKCLECHGDDIQEGELNFDDRETLADFIIAGNRNESEIYRVLVSDDEDELMPPPYDVESGDAEAMSPAEIELVGRWVDQGAKYESVSESVTEPVTESSNKQVDAANGIQEPKPVKEQQHIAMRIWRFLGSFHAALVHFPIALFMLGAFFVIFCRRNMALANEASFYCLALGMLGAIVAAAVGWSLAFEQMHKHDNSNIFNMDGSMFWHRWSGVIVAVLALIIWIVAWRQRSDEYADGGGSWKLGLILLAGIVGLVGYQGGELAHNEGYYFKQLKKYLPEAHTAIFPDEPDVGENGDTKKSPDESKDKTAEKTSSDNSSKDEVSKAEDGKSTDGNSDRESKETTESNAVDDDIDT